jgi:hypothetical protein
MVSFPILFAWSWGGHGQMTVAAIALAIARLIPLGKVAVMRRLNQFGKLRAGADRGSFGSTPSKQAAARIEADLKGIDGQSPTTMQQNLIHLFEDLPSIVQEQDLHLGNLPYVGEYVGYIPIIGAGQQNAQIRHFMRSHKDTRLDDAFLASRAHIWNQLYYAWYYMRRGVYDKSHWYDFIWDRAISDFDDGIDHLGAALHTIEDSYAPGHVKRNLTSGVIEDIHYWDKENREKDTAHNWPGHEALDDPNTLQSKPFYQLGLGATASLIVAVLANLDQPYAIYKSNCTPLFNKYFAASFAVAQQAISTQPKAK